MRNPVGWFDIYVSEIKRAQKFYESVFDIELSDLEDPSDPSIIMKKFPENMENYGITGALVKMEGMPVGQNSVIVYFSCEDCAIEEARVAQLGGTVEKPKFSIGDYGFISIVKDTEGNIFGLHSQK